MVTSDSNATSVGASSASGLSKGTIAGLIIGLLSLLLGTAIVVIVVALVLMKHKQSKGKYSTRKQHAFGMTKYVCNLHDHEFQHGFMKADKTIAQYHAYKESQFHESRCSL